MGAVVRGTAAVVVTGRGFTVVEVEVDDVEVDVDEEVDEEVADVVGSATTLGGAATAGRLGVADAPAAHHATVAAIIANTPRTAPMPSSGRWVAAAKGIRPCRRFP